MSCMIAFTNLANGQSINLPFQATANIMGMPILGGMGSSKITAASQQIDGGALGGCSTSSGIGTSLASVGVNLAGFANGTNHTLTLVAFDDQSQNSTNQSVTFHVGTMPPPPMPTVQRA